MNPKPIILAVDDTPAHLELLEALLTPAGYLVRRAAGGETALAAVAADPPDLILLDLRMPDMDGFEVCRRLKAGEKTTHIPIILLSASADSKEWVAGLQLGAVDFIAKPFQREELLARVSTHLTLSRANLSLKEQAETLARTNRQLQAESVIRHDAEDEVRLSLARAERSRRALLSALEDQKKAEAKIRRNESRLQSLVHILQYRAKSRQEFLDHALAEVIRITESRFGYIYFYNEERQEFILNSWSKDVMATCSVVDPQSCYALDKTGFWGEVVRQRKAIVLNDFPSAHPLKKGYPEGHLPLTRFLTVPVFAEEKIVAVVGVANKIRDYDDIDVLQLTLLMDAVWKTLSIKDSEEALRQHTDEMATILDILPAVVWVGLDPDCRVILGNRAANELAGITAGTNISQSAVATGHAVPLTPLKEDGSLFMPEELPMQRAVALAQPVEEVELRLGFADGRLVDLLGSAAPLFDAEGQVRGSVAAFTDITERKAAEARLRKLNRTYALLSSLSQTIVRVHEPDALFAAACRIAVEQGGFRMAWVARLDGQTRRVRVAIYAGTNDGYLEKLDICLDDRTRGHGPTATALQDGQRVVINDIASDPRMDPWRDAALQRGYRSAIFLPLMVAGAVYGTLNLYAPDAHFFDDMEVQLLTELASTLSFALEFATREAQRREAEAEIRSLNATLEERVQQRTTELLATNKELETFSYSVSHDLRAPLRAIDGFTKILLEDYAPRLDDEGLRICGVISYNTRRMGELIDALLAFSRLGRTEIRSVGVDMTALAAEVFAELTTPQERERIDFSLATLPRASGDPALLRQVWVNLLANAVKFSAKQPRASIAVTARHEGNEGIYTVRDNGVGFNMDYAKKLFGVFQRLHSDKEFSGTGLGLALVQRIVQRHGGRIWAEGEPGKGAKFYFTLNDIGTSNPA
ncbi:MAG: hypothetical protein A2091_03595 [Desulfuromonadales bacterium GWD2_61_12]|nr:MAG: hypothetical protein A2091_03595 [Desulfuromonadales bacterium GWD2_61_12]